MAKRFLLSILACLIATVGTAGVDSASHIARAMGRSARIPAYFKQASYDNVSFTYGSSLAGIVAGSYYAAHQEFGQMAGPSIGFTFDHYILGGKEASLVVYPLTPPYPVDGWLRGTAQSLRTLLRTRPNLAASAFPASLPFAPRVEGGQAFIAKPLYLRFRNGTGIAYLTAWSDAYITIANDTPVVFDFVGITDDGHFFVSAQFPLYVSGLPDHQPPMTSARFQHLVEHYKAYTQGIVKKLDALRDDQFLPHLNYLRLLAESLYAHPSLIPPAAITLYVDGASGGYTGANLRARPTRQAALLAFIPNGTAVQAAPVPAEDADGEQWYRVTYHGQTGYVLWSLLSRAAP